jgi:ABC-2 type transport system ATP-binding protein
VALAGLVRSPGTLLSDGSVGRLQNIPPDRTNLLPSDDGFSAISIRNVTKRFSGVVAVNDLDLTVPSGSLDGFIGPNGSGKPTTLRMIMHILLPDQGEIEVLGERDTRAARDRVSYLPEERGLYKRMSVRRLLRYYGLLKGAKQPDLDRSITHWLERLGLAAWIDKRVEALSKGMAQKVQFIASVLNRPEL